MLVFVGNNSLLSRDQRVYRTFAGHYGTKSSVHGINRWWAQYIHGSWLLVRLSILALIISLHLLQTWGACPRMPFYTHTRLTGIHQWYLLHIDLSFLILFFRFTKNIFHRFRHNSSLARGIGTFRHGHQYTRQVCIIRACRFRKQWLYGLCMHVALASLSLYTYIIIYIYKCANWHNMRASEKKTDGLGEAGSSVNYSAYRSPSIGSPCVRRNTSHPCSCRNMTTLHVYICKEPAITLHFPYCNVYWATHCQNIVTNRESRTRSDRSITEHAGRTIQSTHSTDL